MIGKDDHEYSNKQNGFLIGKQYVSDNSTIFINIGSSLAKKIRY